MTNFGDDTVVRIDPATNKVTHRITAGNSPCAVVPGAGAIWVGNYGSGDVTRISLRTLKVEATIQAGLHPNDIQFAAGAIWVTNLADHTVSRIDPTTNKVVATIKVVERPAGIGVTPGAVWIGSQTGFVSRIDVATNAVTNMKTPVPATWATFDRDSVWFSYTAGSGIVKIDAKSGKIAAIIPTADRPTDGDVLNGAVWIAHWGDGSLAKIDPNTNATLARVPTNVANPFVIAAHAGSLWITAFAGTDVVRIDPEKI